MNDLSNAARLEIYAEERLFRSALRRGKRGPSDAAKKDHNFYSNVARIERDKQDALKREDKNY